MDAKPLKIVFMGNPDFAVPSLERLAGSTHRLVSVVTGTDKRRGRGARLEPSPVKKAAQKLGLPILQIDNVRSPGFVKQLQELQPDLFVVVAFKILPPGLLAIPDIGSVNLHASLLPKYRGAAPIHWALINGEKETGCTVFMLDEGMDTGSILSRTATPVDIMETTGEVYERLRWMGADLLTGTIDDISKGNYTEEKQPADKFSKAPAIIVQDARIDFQKDCLTVHNHIRGMSPFPGAWTNFEDRKIKLYRSAPDPAVQLDPGEVQLIRGSCYAGCGSGSIAVMEIQPEGRKKMSGYDFYNGTSGKVIFS